MNNSQKNTSKAIALFLSLGLMSSLASCEIGNTDEGGEGGEDGTTTEQPATEQDEGGEGGEGS
ncbi:MAG: hypothetical protein ACRC8K_01430 [Waterburya sp.]